MSKKSIILEIDETELNILVQSIQHLLQLGLYKDVYVNLINKLLSTKGEENDNVGTNK